MKDYPLNNHPKKIIIKAEMFGEMLGMPRRCVEIIVPVEFVSVEIAI